MNTETDVEISKTTEFKDIDTHFMLNKIKNTDTSLDMNIDSATAMDVDEFGQVWVSILCKSPSHLICHRSAAVSLQLGFQPELWARTAPTNHVARNQTIGSNLSSKVWAFKQKPKLFKSPRYFYMVSFNKGRTGSVGVPAKIADESPVDEGAAAFAVNQGCSGRRSDAQRKAHYQSRNTLVLRAVRHAAPFPCDTCFL